MQQNWLTQGERITSGGTDDLNQQSVNILISDDSCLKGLLLINNDNFQCVCIQIEWQSWGQKNSISVFAGGSIDVGTNTGCGDWKKAILHLMTIANENN